jgi:hypothetical protein
VAADFARILEELAAERVRYVLVGGLAAMEHGSSQLTDDFDLCYDRSRDNLERLSRVLLRLKATLRGAPKDLPFKPDVPTLHAGLNFTFSTVAGDLDILGEMDGVGGYENANQGASDVDTYGVRVRVLGLDDLIRAKKAAGRPKDKAHLLELEELKRLKRKRS